MPKPISEKVEAERVPEEVAERPLDELEGEAGVREAIELYEAAMKHYVAAAPREHITRITSANSV